MTGYLLISGAAAMFSFMFFFNNIYEHECGGSVNAVIKFLIGTSLSGIAVLTVINGFHFAVTPFSAVVAFVCAFNNLIYTICGLRALGKINLSLYSVFCMLGGMALPSVAGILFYDEGITVGKSVCFALIIVSLLITVEKGESKKGFVYYAGIFITNGMSGVIAKFYASYAGNKVSDAEYSILSAACLIVLCLIILPFSGKEKVKVTGKAAGSMLGCGILSHVGNYILLISLATLPASAQYPFITGGVMILSTVIGYFTPDKPKKKDILSVSVAFAGILALVLI